MRSAREAGVKSRIVKAIRASGRWARRMPSNELTGGGMPDILVLLRQPRGRAMWLEVKKPGEKPTALQLATMLELENGGAAVQVVHSFEEAILAVVVAEALR